MEGINRTATFLAALVLDLGLGDQATAWHPVGWLGQLISLLERRAPRRGRRAQLAYGLALAVAVPALWAGLAAWLLGRLRRRSRPLAWLLEALLLKSTFAVRGLGRAAQTAEERLLAGDLEGARAALRALVGRPTDGLGPEPLASAAVESVAENTTDSFLAPWLYYALLGTPGATAYRAVNTLDSMIGYHGRYEHLGWAAARLDDLLSFTPARLSAMLTVAAAALVGASPAKAWRTLRRCHARTESPNAGWTMSAMAGALGVQLERADHYRLGEPERPLAPERIAEAVHIMWLVAALGAMVTIILMGARHVLAADR